MEQKKQIPPRPQWNDDMNRELIQFTIGLIEEWDNIDHSCDEIDIYLGGVKGLRNADGYAIACQLHCCMCVIPDSNLVRALDKVAPHAESILQDAVKKWVKDHDIKPKLRTGGEIMVTIDTGQKVPRKIVAIRKLTARYVMYGADRESMYIPFEDVHSLEGE